VHKKFDDDWECSFGDMLACLTGRAGFKCMEALGRIIIRGQSGGVLV